MLRNSFCTGNIHSARNEFFANHIAETLTGNGCFLEQPTNPSQANRLEGCDKIESAQRLLLLPRQVQHLTSGAPIRRRGFNQHHRYNPTCLWAKILQTWAAAFRSSKAKCASCWSYQYYYGLDRCRTNDSHSRELDENLGKIDRRCTVATIQQYKKTVSVMSNPTNRLLLLTPGPPFQKVSTRTKREYTHTQSPPPCNRDPTFSRFTLWMINGQDRPAGFRQLKILKGRLLPTP